MFANLTPDVADCDSFRKMSAISDATMIRTLEGSKVLPTLEGDLNLNFRDNSSFIDLSLKALS